MSTGRHFIRGARFPLIVAFAALIANAAHAGGADTVEIDTATGHHDFHVSVMRSEAERERGLMFVRSMPQDSGMLFDFQTSQPIMMWMHNTLIGLDMVFIASDGHVVNIAHDAKPEDDTVIPSKGAVLGVLEINAGRAKAIGLKIGDLVHHPMFHEPSKPN